MSQLAFNPRLLQAYAAQSPNYTPAQDPPAGFRAPMIFLLIICIGLVSYWGGQSISEQLAVLSQIIVGLLAVVVVGNLFMTGAPVVFTREFVFMGLFFSWALVGFPFAPDANLARTGLTTLAKLIATGVVILNVVNGPRAYKWFLRAVLTAALLAALLGALGIVRGQEESLPGVGNVAERYKGAFGNPNGLGHLMCVGSWGALCLLMSTRGQARKVFLIASIAFCVVTVGATGSKQSILALIFGTVGLYWFVIRKSSRGFGWRLGAMSVVGVAAVCMLVYLSTTVFWGRIERLTGMSDDTMERSDKARLSFLIRSGEAAIENPVLGLGYGGIQRELGGLMRRNPHNTILAIAADTGFVGWTFFFGAWLAALLRLRKAARLDMPQDQRMLLLNGWILHIMLGLWAFTTFFPTDKLFWGCFAANIAYTAWIERAYGSRARAHESFPRTATRTV